MKVKIVQVSTGAEIEALIKSGKVSEMPSMHDGWRYNFDKELKNLRHATGYLLLSDGPPEVLEGCMIFQLIDKKEPYLAMIEVAPHNKGREKLHENVAGCLIAYAYQESVKQGVGHFKAYLQLDVMEEKEEDQMKLMQVYSSKYNAKRIDETTMVICDEDGENLIERYLQKME